MQGYDLQATILNCKTTSLLIVDDHKDTRDLLAFYFCRHYRCATAATAEEAIDLLQERFFNVVITDVEMPGASGIELCRQIRNTHPDIKVLVMSGLAGSQNRIKALQHGAFDYLSKPLNLETVEKLIQYALLPTPA